MLKRAFDFIVSLLVILIALPLAQRIGKDGKPFTLYKFRTMVADAPNRGPAITRNADPRITRVGHFLRKLKTSS